jgi:pimeloyl-ACP methyl ester carboxylesterase
MHDSSSLILATALAVAASCTSASRKAPMQPPSTVAAKHGHVAVDGIDYYYEIHGQGEPLLLLHGGLGSIDMFRPILPALSDGRQVIAVDLQGHGRTSLGTRPITLVDSGNDMAAILDKLALPQVDVLGYSFGGGIALRLAVQHPQRVRRLVIASAPFARDGFYPEMLPQQAAVGAAMADMMKDTPMYKSYVAVAPHPEDFPKLLDRMGELMRTPYNYAEDVEKLAMPTMLVYGDSDMIRLDHVVEFYRLLGGGTRDAGWQREHMAKNRLAIIPDTTHYEMFMKPQLATTVRPFLDGTAAAPSWGEQRSAR